MAKHSKLILIGVVVIACILLGLGLKWLVYDMRMGFCSSSTKEMIVRGTSMSGEFESGDSLMVDLNYYSCRSVHRGDVAIFEQIPGKDPIVKNIFVIPGDSFALVRDDGSYYMTVNGKKLIAPDGRIYRFTDKRLRMLQLYENEFKGVMPAETYFVFGSNPYGTRDSSQFGPIRHEQLRGRVMQVRRQGSAF